MRRFFRNVNLALIVGMLAFAFWAWPLLPDRIPTHFGISGEPDAWSDRSLLSWLGMPALAIGLTLVMELFIRVLPHRPRWVNLPDRRRLSDLPEAARGPVLDLLAGFMTMIQTETLLIFYLVQYSIYQAAMGRESQGTMILVLLLAILTGPVFLVVFFLGFQRAMAEGKRRVEAEEGARSGRGASLVLALLLLSGQGGALAAQEALSVSSPDGRIVATLTVEDEGIRYAVSRDGREVILPSRLGLDLVGAPPLGPGLAVASVERRAEDETWEQPWGEVRFIRSHFQELRVRLAEGGAAGGVSMAGSDGARAGGGSNAEREGGASTPRELTLVFRLFDDGLGFRYELPEQAALDSFAIGRERTEFHLAGLANAWWIPANQPDRYEYLYRSGPVSTLPAVHTPLTMKTAEGLYLVIHEAALTDYAAMNVVGTGTSRLATELAPWADGVAAYGRTPFVTPWRTLQIADRAADLLTSWLVLNLNEPSRIEDTSWIRPMKYVGIWWEMHLGTSTWGSGPQHGATTANAKRYIDFAAENGFGGVLVEGWNVGWDGDWQANADRFSFTRPYPDYDLEGLAAYAAERGVALIGHNETSMGVRNYEAQLEEAFRLYESLDIPAVKTGYVGNRTQEGHAHHGQAMVRHWRTVVEAAARHRIALNVHEPIKDTGIRRTWPNMLTREGARGQEYNAWGGDGGNPPEHETILPFTRMLAAPMDFTPGIFALETGRGERNRVNTTLAKQLALYVVLYSPLQMAADLPESYRDQPAFQFIRDVPVDWAETVVPNGEIGDYLTVARKDRHSDTWFLGAVTDEEGRALEVPLSFLDPGRPYMAEIYADGPGADWATAPYEMEIWRERVDFRTVLTVTLAAGGGQAIRIRPIDEDGRAAIPGNR